MFIKLLNTAIFFFQCLNTNSGSQITNNYCNGDICNNVAPVIPSFDNHKQFIMKNCFCDGECFKFGDCCKNVSLHYQPIQSEELICEKVYWLKKDQHFYFKSICNTKWTFLETITQCETNVNPIEDPFRTIPVVSYKSGIMYKNIFCATCNFESSSDLKFWKINVTCPFDYTEYNIGSISEVQELAHYNTITGQWDVRVKESNANGYLILQCTNSIDPLPEMSKILRPCKPIISTCISQWIGSDASTKCKEYNAYRYVYNGDSKKIYKNIHCAICNNEPPDKIECSEKNFLMPKPSETVKMQFPIHMLVKRSIFKRDTTSNNRNEKCTAGETFNPFENKCIKIINCGRFGQHKKNEECKELD